MKVIDTLIQKDFHGAFEKFFEQYKCIVSGGDYLEVDLSFICVLSIKVPIRKKSGNLFNDPCIFFFFYVEELCCELNYHDRKIRRTLTHDIRKHWIAVSTLCLISSV